jgi:HD-GYP domain-containing protein (c-di-GMP phosphodiesterase class II)
MSAVGSNYQTLSQFLGPSEQHDRLSLIERLRLLDDSLFLHAGLVAAMAKLVADRFRLDDDDRTHLIDAAWLHDIGKLTVSPAILDKPGTLDADEWSEIRRHSARGAGYLASSASLRHLAPLVRHHHERFDGAGYPDGIGGNSIPFGARIICVVDAYDAMTTDRPYRHTLERDAALDELRRCAGTQFDPKIVETFCSIHPLLEKGHAT